jgi:cell division protein FtsB
MEEFITISRLEYDQLKAQAAELTELKALVERLMAEISFLKNGHNSKTSSTPPFSGYCTQQYVESSRKKRQTHRRSSGS